MTPRAAGFALLLCGSVASPCAAQTEAPPRTCGPQSALFTTEKGVRVWITRKGSAIAAPNPLRPLSRDQLLVLQVVVNGRVATAYGLDYASLRQGGPPARLEAEGLKPIIWAPDLGEMPEAMRVVSEDGTPVVDGLRFAECGDVQKTGARAGTPLPRAAEAPGLRPTLPGDEP